MRPQLIAKAIFFTLLMPGTMTVLLPSLILGRSAIENVFELSLVRVGVGIVGLTGTGILLYCIWGFAFYGGGTLAPIDPPKTLVVRGLYRYNRNPMYVGVLTVVLAEAALFQSRDLLVYAGILFVCFTLFVLIYEEPHLKAKFGGQYLEYCHTVPRWGVAIRPYKHTTDVT